MVYGTALRPGRNVWLTDITAHSHHVPSRPPTPALFFLALALALIPILTFPFVSFSSLINKRLDFELSAEHTAAATKAGEAFDEVVNSVELKILQTQVRESPSSREHALHILPFCTTSACAVEVTSGSMTLHILLFLTKAARAVQEK